ncbi:MAG: hypothetical protein KAS32_14385, partial [Candidatus Peribacteraceae bacterium]|nr:hypothetical protein [Candidatus Peribacteraceae bacterium]
NGNFWNIVEITIVTADQLPPPQTAETQPEGNVPNEPTPKKKKGNPNDSYSLSYAKDVGVAALTTAQVSPTEIKTFITTLASSFRDWFDE